MAFGRRARATETVAESKARAEARPAAPAADRGKARPASVIDTTKPVVLDASATEVRDKVFAQFFESFEASDIKKMNHEDQEKARSEIADVLTEMIRMQDRPVSEVERQSIITDILNDVFGLGPLEPLLARDDIADIMVNGPNRVYIEVGGKVELTEVRFRDDKHLINIAQKIVQAVGRRVDESSPICDARLLDGSRVNVIAPPLAIDGTAVTIRKFRRERFKLDDLVRLGSLSPDAATLLRVIAGCHCNVLISGGTGSGKTTLLNCMTAFIDEAERIVTLEDAAELQLQQPHVVRLETRPPNLEGVGEVPMMALVKNCLRMRPNRIIVGEVRGPEALQLIQAMSSGHDGSMGTVHSNSPREAIKRLETMIAMGGFNFTPKTVRELIVDSVDVIVQASRLRDGTRVVTHISEVIGMEGDTPTIQDLMVFEYQGEDSLGKIVGRHRLQPIRPKFWDKARYYGYERELVNVFGG